MLCFFKIEEKLVLLNYIIVSSEAIIVHAILKLITMKDKAG